MANTDSAIINFDHAEQRKMFNGWVRSLKGAHKVSIKKCRAVRSLNQNAWYWSCVLPAVARGLHEAWGESLSIEDTHEFLKSHFNARTIVDRSTGEVKGHQPRSTADLDTKEFSEFIDKVTKFAGEQLKIEIPPPT